MGSMTIASMRTGNQVALDPAQRNELERTRRVISLIHDLCDDLVDGSRWASGTDLDRIRRDLPEVPVDLSDTFRFGATQTRDCLGLTYALITAPDAYPVSLLLTLLRPALFGAARCVYVLQPSDHATRLARALDVVRQETKSLHQAYDAVEKFRHLPWLAPSTEVLNEQRRLQKNVNSQRPPGEGTMLVRVAESVAGGLSTHESVTPDERTRVSEGYKEMILWNFNMLSGISHGYAWPRMMAEPDVIRELSVIASTAHLATQLLLDRTEI